MKRSLRGVPKDAHEWVSFPDPDEERTWMFDVTFLESSWTCIFGRGCQGVLTGPAPELVEGCCSYGAHFADDEDVARVEKAATTLSSTQWQYRSKGLRAKKGSASPSTVRVVERSPSGVATTRIVDGACIFLNRPGFPGGPGCSLHRAAIERGIPHLELKPDVCWQLPLRREDEVGSDGWVTSIVRQWDRRDWGEGGREFHWWCTEAPDAFVGSRPAFEELRDELVAMVGQKVHKRLVAYLRGRRAAGSARSTPKADRAAVANARDATTPPTLSARNPQLAVKLPHPALRRA